MKRYILSLAALLLSASLSALAQSVPASTNVPTKDYPCVDAEGRATFQLAAPTATDVQVDICNKKYPLTKDENGVWTGTTDPLVVGFHYYALLVDGVRVNDPNHRDSGKAGSGRLLYLQSGRPARPGARVPVLE